MFDRWTKRDPSSPQRALDLFDQQWSANARRTDRMFAVLMILQWIAAIVVSLVMSPRTWAGTHSQIHPHVLLSVCFGGVLAAMPVYLAWQAPGQAITRHVIAIAQVLFSSLLIHVSGGRIETHFHVFGSLAFLAFYRDWTVLAPATLVVAADHFIRGVFWPETVFGIETASQWRWVEHAGWVIFEDIFLIVSCRYGVHEMMSIARRTAELEQVNRDIRNQSAALEAACQAKHAIVETALDAVIGMNAKGLITAWNSQAADAFGWEENEVLGKSLAETIIPPKYRQLHASGLQNYLESGQSRVLNRRIEVCALHRDGREFPVELSIAPIHSGDEINFCAFIRDITQRIQASEALQAAKEQAEAASHAKSAFLANMSHEIRTPLNGILGFTDLLLSGSDHDANEQRDYLETIQTSGRHLLTLINDVLDLSKIESGQMEVEMVRCVPHDIIAEVVSILRVRAQERGLSLEYFWKSEIPESIRTDPARLRQILINLIGNAIKFTEVGSVQVAVRLIADESPRLAIDVIDTGVGIDSSGIDRVFDAFVQADSSITRRFGGTGLGLSISRRLARLLGGDLAVDSELGRGSVFTATIAAGSLDGVRFRQGPATDIVREESKGDAMRPQLPSCRVLLVEDGATNRKLIRLILERAGVAVATAENGRLGVDLALAEPFDIILMDMQMPVLDGYSATRELRTRLIDTPVIALTAHAMAHDEKKCRDAGCSGFLTKPIEPGCLLDLIRETLGQTRPMQQAVSDRLFSTLPTDDLEFQEIVEEFVDRLQEKLEQIQTAVAQGDLDEAAAIAHWVKGSGGTVGFDAWTIPAGELESAARRREVARLPELIRRLTEVGRRVCADPVAS
jgi:PAS domain S-box-containing protein